MDKVKNILENYEAFHKEFKLFMKRVDNHGGSINSDTVGFIQFIKWSDRWKRVCGEAFKEIESIILNGNTSIITEKVKSDHTEIDLWIKDLVKPHIKSGSVEVMMSNIEIYKSFLAFYMPIIRSLPKNNNDGN